MNKIDTVELQKLCIENQWFTCGSTGQYYKLFELNNKGCSLDELALVIWICSESDKWTRRDIKGILKRFVEEKEENQK